VVVGSFGNGARTPEVHDVLPAQVGEALVELSLEGRLAWSEHRHDDLIGRAPRLGARELRHHDRHVLGEPSGLPHPGLHLADAGAADRTGRGTKRR
jgi:hypothetical protein